MDLITPSINGIQAKEICSSEETVPKVRKPYTITKQREKWTEDEHKKFLEALKLHGRAWRRIEEHIGTKTAVQIRSHAQKFFSKVVRESEGCDTGSIKPLEIPPPRPKRKPAHPYPRKSGYSSHKGIAVLEQHEVSPPPIPSVSGQDNSSPTSVLSAVVWDTIPSSVSNLSHCCASPDSSASGSNPVSTLMTEQENQCESHSSTDGEENGSGSSDSLTVGLVLPNKSLMKSEDQVCSEESSLLDTPATSLKLFGKTVLVANSHKHSFSIVGNSQQSPKSLSYVDNQSCKDEEDFHSMPSTLPGNAVQGDFCGGPCKTASSSLLGGVAPFFFCAPFQQQLVTAGEAASAPLPWWAFYGGVPFPMIHLQSMSVGQDLVASSMEVSDDREMQKEGSLNGSDAASTSKGRISCKDLDTSNPQMVESSAVPTFYLKPSKNSAFVSKKSAPENQMKGFVPYKRCLFEREVQQSTIVGEERESQRIRLCL